MTLKIEDNIPIPRPNGRKGEIRLALESLEVGQSIFVPEKDFRSWQVFNAITGAQSNSEKSFSQRFIENGYRIWRTA